MFIKALVSRIAEWYADRGWRILKKVFLFFAYLHLYLGFIALIIVGIVFIAELKNVPLSIIFFVLAPIDFLVACFFVGIMQGDLLFFEKLVQASKRPIVAKTTVINKHFESKVPQKETPSIETTVQSYEELPFETTVAGPFLGIDNSGTRIQLKQGDRVTILRISALDSKKYDIEYDDGRKKHIIEAVPKSFLR